MADETNYYDRPYDLVVNAWFQMENRTNQALANANAVMAQLSDYHIDPGTVAAPSAPVLDITMPDMEPTTPSVVNPGRLEALVNGMEAIPDYVDPSWDDGASYVIPIDDLAIPDFGQSVTLNLPSAPQPIDTSGRPDRPETSSVNLPSAPVIDVSVPELAAPTPSVVDPSRLENLAEAVDAITPFEDPAWEDGSAYFTPIDDLDIPDFNSSVALTVPPAPAPIDLTGKPVRPDIGNIVLPSAPVIDSSLPELASPPAGIVDPSRLENLAEAVEAITPFEDPAWEDGSAYFTPLDDIMVPEFDSAVSLNLPVAPGPIDVSGRPSRPDTDAITLPDSPSLDLPVMAALTPIDVPDFDFSQLPVFQGQPPAFIALPPDVALNWNNGVYASQLLDAVRNRVGAMLMGGTGLPPAIEAALFDRARSRESLAALEATQNAFIAFTGRGFTLPSGILAAQLNAIQETNQLKAGAINRDILVQASQMEVENLRTAVQQGIALEGSLMNLFQAMQSMSLEAAKSQQAAELQLYNASITVFDAMMQAYQTDAEVWKSQVEAKLSVIRASLEAEQLKGTINEQKVRVYVAEWQGVEAEVNLYKAQMEGAQIQSAINRDKLTAWGQDLDGWMKNIEAQKISGIDVYEALLRGENIKVGLLDAEVKAYAAGLDGIKTRANLKVENMNGRLNALKAATEKFGVLSQNARAKVESLAQIASEKMQAMGQVLNAETGRYQAETGYNVQKAELKLKGQQTQVDLFKTLMEGSQIEASINRDKLTAWGQDLDGWIKGIDAQKISGIDVYEALLRGEQIKVSLLGAEVQAYAATLDGLKTKANLRVENTKARLEALRTAVDKYNALSQASRSKVETLAQVVSERLRAEGEVLQAETGRYQAETGYGVQKAELKLKSQQTQVELFKTLMEGAQIEASINRDKLSAWGQDLDGWIKNIEAQKISGIDVYEALLRGENVKVGLLDAEVKAYAATLDGLKTKANLRVENTRARLEALKAGADKYTAQSQGARTKVETLAQVATSKLQAMGQVVNAETGRFQAETDFSVKKGDLKMRGQEAQCRLYMAEFEVFIKEFDMAQARLIEQAKIIQGSIEAAGQMAAQLAAGYGAAMHASATMQGSAHISSQSSYSENHNYDETTV